MMIALSITALLSASTYALVADTAAQREVIEARAEQLQNFLRFRRLLARDLRSLTGDIKDSVSLEGNQLVLRCRGNVVWGHRLGSQVLVSYRWESVHEDDRIHFERKVTRSGTEDAEPGWAESFSSDIVGLDLTFMDKHGWSSADQTDLRSARAIRWQINYAQIGTWELLLPLEF